MNLFYEEDLSDEEAEDYLYKATESPKSTKKKLELDKQEKRRSKVSKGGIASNFR